MQFELEPVIHDGHKSIDAYLTRDFYEKITEEVLEAHERAIQLDATRLAMLKAGRLFNVTLYVENEAEELLDVMTACTTRINALGLEPEVLADLQKKIIDRNRERGYLEG